MANYKFNKDIIVAKKTEEEVAGILEKLYDAKILAYNNDNRYDLLVNIKGKELKVEIKEDMMGETTGNVGLEFYSRGKDSGIRTTQADYYIYKLHTKDHGIQFVLHSVDTLRKMVDNAEFFRIVDGGDPGSHSFNYLFKYNMFVKRGKILPLDKIR
jgi:hypothetical protein